MKDKDIELKSTYRDFRVGLDVKQNDTFLLVVEGWIPDCRPNLAIEHLDFNAFCSGVVIGISKKIVVRLVSSNLQGGVTESVQTNSDELE